MDLSTTVRKLRKSIASFTVLAIVASLSIASSVSAFSDVSESATYAAYVQELVDAGVIDGSQAKFRPTDKLNRAEAAKIAVKAAGVEDADLASPATGTFSDVSKTLWDGMGYKYIETAAALGIVKGDAGKTTFRPGDAVSRVELAAILVRALELDEDLAGAPHFSDVTSALWNGEGLKVVETAYNWNVVSGYPDGTFKPGNPVIRQDMAAMASRAMEGEKRTTTTPPVQTGAVSVALASDNPAGYPVIVDQSGVVLAKFTFTGTGTVTALNLKRIGVSADASLGNVYLFEGDTRISDASSVSSGSVVNFTNAGGLFTVSGSKTISVRADLAASSGESLGVALTSVTSGGTATAVSLSGNLFSTAGTTSTLADVTLAATATGSGATDPGLDVLLWQNSVTVATRDVSLSRLALRQIGSIQSADMKNFKLYVDGVQVATAAALDANGYVTFTGFAKTMATGTRTVKVTGDIIGGSGRTVQMSLRGVYDVMVTDTQYNAGIKVVLASGSFPLAPSSFTVNPGTMTVVKTTDSASQNVTVGASDQSLAKYTFTAYGESVKVETLNVGMITTGGTVTEHTIRNVRVLVNGGQVGNTTPVPAAATFASAAGTQFTTNFTVVPGTPAIVEIRGDIYDSEDTDNIAAGAATAVQALLVGGSSANNAVPQVSLGTLDVPSQANALGNNLTITSGSISIAKQSNYADQTTVVPATAYKIGGFNLIGNSTEAVNINTVHVCFSATSTGAPATDLTDLYVKYGTAGTMTPVKGTVFGNGDDTGINPNSGCNTWSVNFPLAVNETMPMDVYATIASTLSTNTIISTLAVAGITASSSTTVYGDSTSSNSTLDTTGFTGQTITGGTGSFAAAVDGGSTPDSALVDDSGTVITEAVKFTATTDSFTVTDLTFTVANATAVQTVTLLDNGTPVAGGSKPYGTSSVVFNGLNIVVAANTTKILNVQLTMGPVGVGAGTSASSLLTTLSSLTRRNSSGTSVTITPAAAGNVMYVYHAVPTITPVALPSSTLTAGTKTLAKFTISSNGTGTVGWQKIAFAVTKNVAGTDTLASPTLWNADSNTQITGTGVFTGGVSADDDVSGGIVFTANAEQSVTGAKTYELRAVVAGSPAAGNSITTSIASPSSYAANAAAFALHSASSIYYSDTDASGTVTANDVRQTAGQASTTAAYGQTNTGAVTFDSAGDTLDEALSYGAITTGQTIILTETGGTSNTIGAITGTLVSAGLFTCTAYDAADGGGSSTVTIASIQSVKCTKSGAQLVLNVDPLGGNGGVEVTTITLTTTTFAIGSTVAAIDSDLGLSLTGGVAGTASFVWSDQSASAHDSTTTDWTNDALVKTLPTVTQSIQL